MNEKKNIDRLFQEKFRNFEVKPDEDIWNRIEADLHGNNKSRKLLPLWWKLGGVAAALILLFSLGYEMFSTDDAASVPVVDVQNDAVDKDTIEPGNVISPENIENAVNNSEAVAGVSSVQSDVSGSASADKTSTGSVKSNLLQQNTATGQVKESATIPATSIVSVSSDKVESLSGPDKTTDNIAGNITVKPSELTESITKTDDAFAADQSNDGKKSLFDEIAKNEKETKLAEASNDKRWSVSPSLAPVYFNSIGGGSPIDTQFDDNSKSGDVNMSYGLNVAYQINDRLKVRSGINKVNYGYNTRDIEFTATLQESRFANIKYDESPSIGTSIKVGNNISAVNSEITNSKKTPYTGSIHQEMGYLEIPLELEYRLIDKKLGLNLIGGLSSLFLTNNSVSVESSSLVTKLGEANNINDLNFSTNIGLGFDYKVSEKLELNLEPMFKYQLNTFSNDNGFQPYSLGVYTGFSFRF